MLAEGLRHGIDRFLFFMTSELMQLPTRRHVVSPEGIINDRTIVLDITAEIQPSQFQGSFSEDTNSEHRPPKTG